MIDAVAIRMRYEAVAGHLDERGLRLFAASEARAAGRGGIAAVSQITGIARSTIGRGLKDLDERGGGVAARPRPAQRRRPQGGSGQAARLAQGAAAAGGLGDARRPAGRPAVGEPQPAPSGRRAGRAGISGQPQPGRPPAEGPRLQPAGQRQDPRGQPASRPRRAVPAHQRMSSSASGAAGQPAISVDTKKKELVGDFKNAGRELRPKGQPEAVRVHDFIIPGKGRAVPYGVYDIAANQGWVSVGIDHDTASFAVESIRRWWQRMGRKRYPTAKRLLITADCGGSNGARVRLWKVELQNLANQTGLAITVAHHPPGTSKWNRIEHRMFAFITQNWRGKPLLTHQVIVQLIAATTTRSGLTIACDIDATRYPERRQRSPTTNSQAINIKYDAFHPEWNYTILPKNIRSALPK